MRVEKLDHVHIYVKSLEKGKDTFSRVLGTTFCPTITADERGGDASRQLRSTLSPLGLELLEGSSPEGAIGRVIERRGEGVYALSFKVPDIEEAISELQSKGLRMVSRIELGKIKEAQFHPKDCHGIMIELCEYQEYSSAAIAALGVEL